MNQNLQKINDFLLHAEYLSVEEKASLNKAVIDTEKELEIEASLERVRLKAMSMRSSKDIGNATAILFAELENLGIKTIRCGIIIGKKEENKIELWTATAVDKGQVVQIIGEVDVNIHPLLKGSFDAWVQKKEFFSFKLEGKDKEQYYQSLGLSLNYAISGQMSSLPDHYCTSFMFREGGLFAFSFEPFSPENNSIFKKFAHVFSQTYRRYLDLKQAELQAREAQIEAALEKVRSRSLLMNKSDELQQVVNTVFERLRELEIETDTTSVIILNENSNDMEFWIANREQIYSTMLPIPYSDQILILKDVMDARKQGLDIAKEYSFDEKNQLWNYLFERTDFKEIPDDRKKLLLESKFYTTTVSFTRNTALQLNRYSDKTFTDVENGLLKRFSIVFEQAYVRFLDLLKAETQAREVEIELALEKVRARTMAMQHSDELAEASFLLDSQVRALGIQTRGCAFNIYGENESTEWFSSEMGTMPVYKTPRENVFLRYYQEGQKGKSMYIDSFVGDACAAHYEYLCTLPVMGEALKKMIESGGSFPDQQTDHVTYFKYGYLLFITLEQVPEAHDIFLRFAKVFEQTYTRFLDLQKAEAQAREAQIEAALEKVRSSSLAMHNSDQLREIVKVVFEKLKELKFAIDGGAFVGTISYNSDYLDYWVGDDHAEYPGSFKIPKYDAPTINDVWNAKKSGVEFISKTYSFKEKNIWFEYAFNNTDLKSALPEDFKKWILEQEYLTQSFAMQKNSMIGVHFHHAKTLTENEIDILKRFSRVFEQSYVRFLDLQKAEAQAREAQIETALERVRSRTMGMQRSDELQDAAALMFDQIETFGVQIMGCGFNIWEDDRKAATSWMSGMDRFQPPFKTSSSEDIFLRIFEAAEMGESLFVEKQAGEELVEHYKYMASIPVFKKILDQLTERGLSAPSYQIMHCAYFSHGYLMFITLEPASTAHDIFRRFAKVFEQTYTRFLDLQKAEAQSREAQIEAALERVRSRTMAMQTGNELGEVVTVIVEKLKDLDVVLDANGVVLCTYFQESKDVLHWIVSPDFSFAGSYLLPYFDHPIFNDAWNSKESGDEYFSKAYSVEDKNSFFEYAFEHSDYRHFPDDFKRWVFQNDQHILSFAWQKNSAILIPSHTGVLPSEEEVAILKRFAKVFEQTYTRFLDLQKAEAQTKESQIQLALERVRARTMAMQKSDELQETAALLFMQVTSLGVPAFSCGFNIWEKGDKTFNAFMTGYENTIEPAINLPFNEEPNFKRFDESKRKGEDFYVLEMRGEAMQKHYQYLKRTVPVFREAFDKILEAGLSLPETQIHHIANFSQGNLMFITLEPCPEAYNIFKRFAKVFEQTYTRFLDLQKAEAQAKQAIKASSLDRVRAEIASMRTVGDLQRITPVIWHELITLGVPFIRCGVFIMDEEKSNVQVYLSTPEGHSVAVLNLPFKSSRLTSQTVDHWRKGIVYKEHWNKDQFINWAQSMVNMGQIQNRETYQSSGNAPESLDLNFVPFTQGMLYVGNVSPLSEEKIELVKSLADAFSIAYSRYEDFNKLEKAKESIEATLTELKATQSQLIQSEKMASLGELTAGIAHEIQNPLNFVNNFSEVSKELLDEMKTELDNGNTEDAKELADDVILNLEKINHHGKRADAIVKGMLQHSRTSTGQKEPTDINALADEYLRLSYHGLRAKDKSFNADFRIEADVSIPKINVVPQDIGRVLLNLINNAFYAVAEKAKQNGNSFKPLVVVKTARLDNKIEIRVEDNGSGIPENVKEKIFQPFFTTKPTGQGTGLGLSLSYDIVKAHGGELILETTEGIGSEFIIRLPKTTV